MPEGCNAAEDNLVERQGCKLKWLQGEVYRLCTSALWHEVESSRWSHGDLFSLVVGRGTVIAQSVGVFLLLRLPSASFLSASIDWMRNALSPFLVYWAISVARPTLQLGILVQVNHVHNPFGQTRVCRQRFLQEVLQLAEKGCRALAGHDERNVQPQGIHCIEGYVAGPFWLGGPLLPARPVQRIKELVSQCPSLSEAQRLVPCWSEACQIVTSFNLH